MKKRSFFSLLALCLVGIVGIALSTQVFAKKTSPLGMFAKTKRCVFHADCVAGGPPRGFQCIGTGNECDASHTAQADCQPLATLNFSCVCNGSSFSCITVTNAKDCNPNAIGGSGTD